jgi:hypothetical protein
MMVISAAVTHGVTAFSMQAKTYQKQYIII